MSVIILTSTLLMAPLIIIILITIQTAITAKVTILFVMLKMYLKEVPNGPKDVCKMSNNCLVETAKHLADVFKMSKRQFFANLNSV